MEARVRRVVERTLLVLGLLAVADGFTEILFFTIHGESYIQPTALLLFILGAILLAIWCALPLWGESSGRGEGD